MPDPSITAPLFKYLGSVDYESTWRAMQRFTDERDERTRDQIWCLEHKPVFTLGMNGKPEHILAAGDIPVVQIDRGGQVTYHGPGQLVVYTLLDLRRHQRSVRELVMALEATVINTVADWGVHAEADRSAPGVYVAGSKLASVGLRIRRGCAYHGLAFNVAMDLQPFQRINPCGYQGLQVVDLKTLGVMSSVSAVAHALAYRLLEAFGLSTEPEWDLTATPVLAHTR